MTMTADRARAHERYGIAAKPTMEERLADIERQLSVLSEAHGDAYTAAAKTFSECADIFKSDSFWATSPLNRPFESGAAAFQRVGDLINSLPPYQGKAEPPESSMPKPLPCPFCGGAPYMSTTRSSHGWETRINCPVDCCPAEPSTLGVHKDKHTESARIAIERWNKRA